MTWSDTHFVDMFVCLDEVDAQLAQWCVGCISERRRLLRHSCCRRSHVGHGNVMLLQPLMLVELLQLL